MVQPERCQWWQTQSGPAGEPFMVVDRKHMDMQLAEKQQQRSKSIDGGWHSWFWTERSKPGGRGHNRKPFLRRACGGSTALRVMLLLSLAVSTHMSTADSEKQEDHTGGAWGEYERLVSARGTHKGAGTDVLLHYAHTKVQHRQRFNTGNSPLADRLDTHLHTSHGPYAVSSEQASIKSSHSVQKHNSFQSASSVASATFERSILRNVDVTQEGVVALGTDPPEGNPGVGVIAAWPIAKPGGKRNRHTQGHQPMVVLLDMFAQRKTQFCTGFAGCSEVSHPVTAAIFNNPGCAKLHGTTTVQSVNGVAIFTDLMIDLPQSLYRLRFTAGLKFAPVEKLTPPFKVLQGQIYIPDDAVWNFDATGSMVCKGCASCSCSAPQSFPPLKRLSIYAGEPVQSTGDPGASFHPCAGYVFPTVWVRKYHMHQGSAGSECDGWEDVSDWDFSIQVSIPDPGCRLIDADTQTIVCRTGLCHLLRQPPSTPSLHVPSRSLHLRRPAGARGGWGFLMPPRATRNQLRSADFCVVKSAAIGTGTR